MNNPSPTIVTLSAHALYHASLFQAGKNDIREYLQGVCLQSTPSGVTVVATDGHCLGAALSPTQNGSLPQEFDEIVLVVDAPLRTALCKQTADKARVEVTEFSKYATVTVTYTNSVDHVTHRAKLIDWFPYPDWRKSVRKMAASLASADPGDAPGANVFSLVEPHISVWQMLSAVHGRNPVVQFHVTSGSSSTGGEGAVVRFDYHGHFLGFIFSRRIPALRPSVPDWATMR